MYSVFTVKLTIYIQWIRKITETSWVTIFWELHNLFLKIDATFLLKYLLIFPNPLDILQRMPYFIKWSAKGGGSQKIWFMNDPLAFLCLEPLCFERSVASKSFLGKSSFLWKPYITHTGGGWGCFRNKRIRFHFLVSSKFQHFKNEYLIFFVLWTFWRKIVSIN